MNGIDVSNNNQSVDWAGVEFCFYKATEGVSFTDQTQASWANKVSVDGPYHFAHPDRNSPEAEAAHFLAKAIPGRMWALDCETYGQVDPLGIIGPARLAAWCDRFFELVAPVLGPVGYHYTFRSYAATLWPRLQQPWRWWLASAAGKPTYRTYAGRVVDIEQYAIVAGVDRDISYTPIASEDPDMTDAEHQMLADTRQLASDALIAATQALTAARSAATNGSWVLGVDPNTGAETGHGITTIETIVTDLAAKVEALAAKVATIETGGLAGDVPFTGTIHASG